MWFMCLVVKLCPTLCQPKDSSLSGFSVHGIFQARILDWVAISFSKMWLWLTICIFFLILSWLRASLLHWSIWPVSYKKKMITRKYTSSYFVPHFLAPTKKKIISYFFSIKFKEIVVFLQYTFMSNLRKHVVSEMRSLALFSSFSVPLMP